MNTSLSQLIPEGEPRFARPEGEPRFSRPEGAPRFARAPSASSGGNAHSFPLSSPPDPFFSRVSIRLATARDRSAVERLAQLDSARAPRGETLLGEVNGRPVVALSLSDGTAIADPFMTTRPIVELVRLRAQQLRPNARGVHRRPFHE